MKTLQALNAARQLRETETDGIKLSESYAVGVQTGTDTEGRVHLLYLEKVIDPGQSQYRKGDLYAVRTACNSQQPHGVTIPEWDLKEMTCAKCQKVLDRIKENLRKCFIAS